jgi:hypothetical protein
VLAMVLQGSFPGADACLHHFNESGKGIATHFCSKYHNS